MRTATIQIFDLNGPAFLAFYAAMLVIAATWSFWRAREAANRFDRAGYFPELTDPYDTAYLAGGSPRAAQLAVVRLMHSGHIEWKSGFTGKRLIFLKAASGGLNAIERKMLNAVQQRGKGGLPVAEAYTGVLPEMRALEVKLATLGLRPTEGERRKAGWSAALPLIALLATGVIKLGVGLSRGKPIGFLVLFLFVTLILSIIIGSSARRLTKTGEELLTKLRKEKDCASGTSPFAAVCWNLALTGPAVLAGIPAFAAMHRDLERQVGNSAASNSSGGCGSSGCGDGGSGGGGGCGGCGGGGD